MVYGGDKVKEFCYQHAELYKAIISSKNFEQASYEKQLHYGDMASHLLIAVMQRGSSPKIPVLEEIAATAAAVQNILLGATSAGITTFWSTSGMTHHPAMKDFLRLRQEDVILGMIYLGYSDEQSEGKRQTSIEQKVIWK
jgi:Nitroreductase